uniref:GRIP domain-containing protein n=1 Tax=Meloidogyne incognita TaxID=6306 RepID=A0A914MQH8_MELIC
KEKQQIQQFQNKEELIQLTQTTNLDKLNYLESQLKIKNDLIDELENSLEEFRILQQQQELNLDDPKIFKNSQQLPATKKIDDSTLKQLFLSFFMAEKSKQPEIAIVMAKILGYSQEEQAQLQKAISASTSSSSWFSFGSSPQPFSRKEVSLTEQFIRFLEQESVDNTKSMLALPPIESTPNRGFLLDESPSALRTSSSTDLKSILDS